MYNVDLSPSAGSLDASFLESPIPPDNQEQIVSYLWGNRYKSQRQNLRPYFQYYTEQCRMAFMSHGDRLGIRTHQHIIDIAVRIQAGSSRSEVKEFIQQGQYNSDARVENAINASIDLTVRLLYMLDIGEFENAYSGRKKLLWAEGPLQDFVWETFAEAVSPENEGTKLDRSFNVCNLVRIAGIQVEPTSNLCDHLRFRDANRTVEVFHHASFLMAHKHTSIFPPNLVNETLETLALIFPQGDKETERWHRKQRGPEQFDDNILRCGKVDRPIGDYKYWHERLVILKTEFDESRPSNITQWWNDRRDVSQWYPLWVAISLTVLFGLVQSIEGALQVYKAYNP